MKTIKILISILIISTFIMLALNAVNMLQAGSKTPDGRNMAQILGVDPASATFNDVEKLSRKDKMQLFYAASAPGFGTLSGEYQARLLSGGILGPSSAYFTHHIFPTGGLTLDTLWTGKAFKSNSASSGAGYNLFSAKNPDGSTVTRRVRPMRTSLGKSKIGKDGKLSFIVDYSLDNDGMIHSMKDEIRQINDNLFIGAGYMALGGGPMNPAPFALIGPPNPWIGPDQ
ncbi:MAG: hypothetical protein MUE70_06000 [Desulfobacterales bacterium]|jgi:hypothetical protein|nr:hypothetical protein [Desulfobacterales bacterium]